MGAEQSFDLQNSVSCMDPGRCDGGGSVAVRKVQKQLLTRSTVERGIRTRKVRKTHPRKLRGCLDPDHLTEVRVVCRTCMRRGRRSYTSRQYLETTSWWVRAAKNAQNSSQKVRKMLTESNAQVNVTDDEGRTPFYMACKTQSSRRQSVAQFSNLDVNNITWLWPRMRRCHVPDPGVLAGTGNSTPRRP
eukprot:479351-Rhodomonas_salina.1